jgi:hypothetical protein
MHEDLGLQHLASKVDSGNQHGSWWAFRWLVRTSELLRFNMPISWHRFGEAGIRVPVFGYLQSHVSSAEDVLSNRCLC